MNNPVYQHMRGNRMETFSFKISEKEDQALNSLANQWGCNRAETARRAILLAHQGTQSASGSAINPDHLREVIAGQKSTIELLIELAKFKPLITRINRLEEYTVQSCLSAGMLARQAGLFDAAKKEFNAWRQNREEQL